MKFRLAVIFILLSLGLAACSFAADITPPPGAASLNTVSTSAAASQTSIPTTAPTQASTAVATDAGSSPTVTGSTTPLAEGTVAPQNNTVVVNGMITPPSGTAMPDGTKATLLIYNPTTQQVEQTLDTAILSDGTYEFNNVSATTGYVFLVTVDYGGVTYNSNPISFDGTMFVLNMPVSVYATSNDLSILSITQTHLQFNFSTTGLVQVTAVYVLSNPGESTVIVPSDGTSIPFIQIPAGAQDTSYQLDSSSAPLLRASNGFAILPGSNLQYVIYATFSLPYTGRLVYTQPFSLPVTSATIIVPEGVKVKSDHLTDGGTKVLSGTNYHLYQGDSLASGSTLTLTISGKPGDKAGFQLDQRTWIMIGVAAIGVVLIALGIYLFVRDRQLRRLDDQAEEEGEQEDGQPDDLENDREGILDAIIALEDKFKAGDISKEAYEKRRDEFKAQLTKLA